MNRRGFLKRVAATAAIATISAAPKIMPPVYGQTTTQAPMEVRVPVATTIPDPNNPFAPGTWDDATRVKLGSCTTTDTKLGWDFCKTPSYLYAKYKPDGPDARLFFFSDGDYITSRANLIGYTYSFDTEDDGDYDFRRWDDIYVDGRIKPGDNPPNYTSQDTSAYGGDLAKGVYRWDFGPSETSGQDHFKAYAEIPMEPLRKHPNPNDSSRIGFNMAIGEVTPQKTWGHDQSLGSYDTRYPDLVFTDVKLPELSWTDLTLMMVVGVSAYLMYRRGTEANENRTERFDSTS